MTCPPPPMPQHVPYAAYAPASDDHTHLKVLSICHYVGGGLIAVFSSVGLIHFGLGLMMVLDGDAFGGGQGPPPPAFVGWLFALLGGAFVLFGWSAGGAAIYSGLCIARRRRRMFSLVVAGVLCLFVPLGTVLGVFTLVVLLKDSVRRLYGEAVG